ncbi:MAG TPA: glycosyltransferase [Nocardioidaceae bacterium]|nr:glycosyltransferase [Nocardioidaceae bacterium]
MDASGRPRRVLIVSAAMGGGHLQISRELERRLVARGHEALVVDQLEVMPAPIGRWLGWVYPWLVDRHPGLYQHVYDVFFAAGQHAGERVGIPVHLALPGLRRVVREFEPDLVASTYPLSALAVGRLRARGELDCPAVTVITTFSVNSAWLHPAVDLELCISEYAAADASVRMGRRAEVSGPIVRPGFLVACPDRHTSRQRLGLPADARVALLTTGSLGLGRTVRHAAEAIAARAGWVPVVVCGRNEELRESLAELAGVVPLGWVDEMPTVMAAADVLVDNAAGMSSKEALGIGLPVVTFQPLTGHGRDDAAALADLGLTDIVTDEAQLLGAIDALVADPVEREARIARGKSLFVADAAEMLERMATRDDASDGRGQWPDATDAEHRLAREA